jgi:hypothetical protein
MLLCTWRDGVIGVGRGAAGSGCGVVAQAARSKVLAKMAKRMAFPVIASAAKQSRPELPQLLWSLAMTIV